MLEIRYHKSNQSWSLWQSLIALIEKTRVGVTISVTVDGIVYENAVETTQRMHVEFCCTTTREKQHLIVEESRQTSRVVVCV